MSQISQSDYAKHSNYDTLGNFDTRNASKTHLVITGHFIIELDIANL